MSRPDGRVGGVGDRLFIEVPGYRLSKLAKIIVNSKLLQGKKISAAPYQQGTPD